MKPIVRFNTIVISSTTIIVFGMWYGISLLLLKYPEWFNNPGNNKYNILGLLVTALISVGVYRLIYLLVSYLVNKFNFIKKIFFSSYYLEGTWVGFYIGIKGKERYIIETFEQNLDTLVIKGTAFDENKKIHSFWTSESINLDIEKGELSYQYKVRSTKEKPDPTGIAYFSMNRENNRKPANMLIGYSSDTHLPRKCTAIEYKLCDKTNYVLKDALEDAEKFYKSKKEFFIK